MNLGAALKELRKDTVFTQKEFSDKIGVSQTYMSLIERGRKIPSMDVIESYGMVCQKPVAIILWKAITEKDVPKSKQRAFKELKPLVDNLIAQMF